MRRAQSINMYIYSWKPVQKSFLINSAQSFLSNNAFIQIKFLVEFTFSFFPNNSKVLAPVNCMVLRENRKAYYINMCLHEGQIWLIVKVAFQLYSYFTVIPNNIQHVSLYCKVWFVLKTLFTWYWTNLGLDWNLIFACLQMNLSC
jgi:hypothetical protein